MSFRFGLSTACSSSGFDTPASSSSVAALVARLLKRRLLKWSCEEHSRRPGRGAEVPKL